MTNLHEACEQVACEGCGDAICTDDLAQDIEGQFCEYCAEQLTETCTYCEIRLPSDDMAEASVEGQPACRDCARDLA